MKKPVKSIIAGTLLLVLAACATTKGAAVGAGIGAIAGDAGKGAAIGASAGAVVDIID
ncbi:hypothetical protein SAMN06295912_1145 [Sphingomonas laterariae]|uniref:YMGG-like Gly-zipper n=1 Tax=Edaphosphingomonas laterariae TaxID=861865 RepID=A0A239GV34_9SPHN|nr:hypothetical protein [Sphingomonas laterariae]SNS73086.1 hypothetical protein SAMN06295912_1145 [Sphingomonas laterariae]